MIDLAKMDSYRTEPPRFWEGRGKLGDSECGAFVLRRHGVNLRIIASIGDGWDHLSVSMAKRCPTWEEMDWIAQRFFRPNEAAMQLHVPASDHINCHPYCLHWWRPHDVDIPRPPDWMVGPKKEKAV